MVLITALSTELYIHAFTTSGKDQIPFKASIFNLKGYRKRRGLFVKALPASLLETKTLGLILFVLRITTVR